MTVVPHCIDGWSWVGYGMMNVEYPTAGVIYVCDICYTLLWIALGPHCLHMRGWYWPLGKGLVPGVQWRVLGHRCSATIRRQRTAAATYHNLYLPVEMQPMLETRTASPIVGTASTASGCRRRRWARGNFFRRTI